MKHLTPIAWLLGLMLVSNVALSAGPEQARRLVIETSNRVLAALTAEKGRRQGQPQAVYALVEKIVLPHFDFKRIARLALGRYVRKANKGQLERFNQAFRTLLVRTYVSALSGNTAQRVDYLPLRAVAGADEVTVRTEVAQPGAFPIPINYRLYLKNGRWKVFDVTIDGVSLVTNYRTSFYREIRQKGLDALIERLAARNREAGA